MCSFGSSSTALREVHWGVPRPSLKKINTYTSPHPAALRLLLFPSSSLCFLPPPSLSFSQVSLTSLYIHTPHIYTYYSTVSCLQHSLPHCPIVVCRCFPPSTRNIHL
ncbi:hypothetical protein COCSADRAFT_302240 [Bipolaris sorokiniana ND90Pr]|uniref:Uncharacterized protein n=1 Tax=Cochliobolus sativus (strain ND90Pr / ATCC 201652) TaxID=665912 RepID=M2TDG1_COCSN|nr:uncharacterized protein COCSADRAFT_302240 [Bipolaris sorokiniana ND90Pr]EMD66787.1 hypothetical protein COCSADRAFT_302240 [Bipolaris sorokiniana ND90Pr]